MKDLMSDKTLTAVQNLQEFAQQQGHTLSQLALAWILRQHDVSSAIIGATKVQQVEENVKAADITLSEDVLKQIDSILGDSVSYARA